MLIALIVSGCGSDSGNSSANGNDESGVTSSADLSLSEDQFYIISASGAINDTYASENWGGEWLERRLHENGVSGAEYWTLRLGGSNSVDATTISQIHLGILMGIAPGTYTIDEGGMMSAPNSEEPVQVFNINVRYPDFEILNDSDEVQGTVTFDTISDEGMSGTIDATLSGEGGEVQVAVRFDVPVTGPPPSPQ